jgi:PAS domain S-box-containing protein
MGTKKNHTDLEKRITELEKKVTLLSKEKDDYRNLFDSILFGVQEIDTKGSIVYANAEDHKIHGYEEGELIGKSIFDFFQTEAEKEELAEYLRYLVQEQPAPTPWFSRDRRKDGKIIDLHIDWNYKRNQDGKVVGFISLLTDITEKKKLEKNLQDSEEKFRLLMDSLEAIVYVADMETYEILVINQYGRKTLGDATGKICWQSLQVDQTGPCDFCTNKYIIDADGNPGSPYIWEFQNTLTDQWFHIVDRVIKWTDGRIVRLEIATDISKRKKAEIALQESEAKYNKLFNSEIDAIAIFDADTREIVDVNSAFLEVYGYSREEALQLKAEDMSGEPERTVASIKASAEKGDTRIRRRLHKKKDGTEIIVDIAAGPVILKDKKFMFGRFHDITDHVRSEKALSESELRFHIAFKTSPDSININKMDGTYIEINEGFTELTGYTRGDVLGRSSLDINIWNDLEDRKTLTEKLKKIGRVENLEAEFLMKDGSIKTALMSASIIHLHGEPHILSITRDITARKKVENDKAKLETQLRQVHKMEAIGTMAGGIAHDFNNILTIIVGNAELARHFTKDEGSVKDYIDQIFKASDRAKKMVRQILAFSRKTKQNLVPVKPHMVLIETLTLLNSTIPSSVKIRQNFDTECRTIKADPTQLNQILINLSANAVYAMNEKGLLEVSLQEVELDKNDTRFKESLKPGPYAMLTVTDTGEGMSSEVIERIFDPFFTTKKFGKGTGLGLSVVHGIVESHGGVISVESTPGKGTTFRLYFPIIDETAVQTANTDPGHYTGNERILFVDDEESLVEIGAEMLKLMGYQVTAETSSLDAFKTFKTNPDNFDLVLTDQTMPNMFGAELAVELLKIRPDIPIILCTGYSSKISDKMAKEIGIADYFMKPFDTKQLAEIVRKTLDRA